MGQTRGEQPSHFMLFVEALVFACALALLIYVEFFN